MLNLRFMTEDGFETRREGGAHIPDSAVAVTDEFGATLYYGYTPDGEGFYFYDSKIELENNHY